MKKSIQAQAPMGAKKVTLIIFSLMVIFFLSGSYSLLLVNSSPVATPAIVSTPEIVTQAEKEKISTWISANKLNQYGDPTDTVYSGGTPLYDSSTGVVTDLYEYMVTKHPDRPWNK